MSRDDAAPTDDDTPRDRFGDDGRERRPRKKSGGFPVWAILLIVFGVCGVCAIPVGIGLMLPAVQKVREAAARAKDSNNMKQVGLGYHNYVGTYDQIPGPYPLKDQLGEPNRGLSHRVALLPYIEQAAVFNQFKTDESWDSPANRPLGNTLVAPYTSPIDPPGTTTTRVQAFVGPGAMYDPTLTKKLRLADVADGLGNTILLVTADDGVVWSKPQDLPFDPNGPVPSFGQRAFPGGTNVVMADGSVRFMRKDTSDAVKKAAITRAGGETIAADW